MKYDSDGINLNTKNILVNDPGEIVEVYKDNSKILREIEIYLLMTHKNLSKSHLTKLLKNIVMNNVHYNKKKKNHEYLLDNGEIISFDLLSDHIIEAPKDLINELKTLNRKGNCHLKAVELCNSFENSIVQTGIITIGKVQYLHSVIQFKDENGNDIIIDYTRDLWIDKSEYIKLFNFEILSSIKSDDIFEDAKLLKELSPFSLKVYLTFRDELMKDINKNKFIFEQEEYKVKTLSKS